LIFFNPRFFNLGFFVYISTIIKTKAMTKSEGFAEWMMKIQSVHYANTPAMERAYCKLLSYEKEEQS
jgi:hypothetical protein